MKLVQKIKLKKFEKFLIRLKDKIRNNKYRVYTKKGYAVYINTFGEFVVFSQDRLMFLEKDEKTLALMEIAGIKIK